MSIIQQHTSASLSDAWRTINIDALDPDSAQNFDVSTLVPPLPEVSEAEVRQLNGQVRQLLRGGDAEGALRGCLEAPVYAGPDAAKLLVFASGNDERMGGSATGIPVAVRSLTPDELAKCRFWWARTELSQGFGRTATAPSRTATWNATK